MHEKLASTVLKQWLQKRKNNPYPTPTEKSKLMEETGLNRSQLDHWFTNARQRYVRPKSRRGPNPNYSRYPHTVTKVLVEWLTNPENMNHPYPSVEDQAELMKKTRLSKRQLQNWFTNARKRRLATRVLKQKSYSSDEESENRYQRVAVTKIEDTASANDNGGVKRKSSEIINRKPLKKKFTGQRIETGESNLEPSRAAMEQFYNQMASSLSLPIAATQTMLLQAQLQSGYNNIFASALAAPSFRATSPQNIENQPFNQIPFSLPLASAIKLNGMGSPRDVCDIRCLQQSTEQHAAANMMLDLYATQKS